MIKFVYFDIGGVMINWDNAFKSVARDFNISYDVFFGVLWKKYDNDITRGIITPQEMWDKIRDDLHITKGKDYYFFLEKWVGDYVCIQPVYELIKTLSCSYRIGIISNIYLGMVDALLKKKMIAPIKYDVIIESCKTGLRKPETAIYCLAEKKAGVNPEEILFIDDKERFLEPPKRRGWHTIVFDTHNAQKSVDEIVSLLNCSL